MINHAEFRASILTSYGANAAETEELLAYNQPVYRLSHLSLPIQVPLAPEPHVPTWEKYTRAAQQTEVFEVLKQHLVQLQFPIENNISQTQAYRLATRRGIDVGDVAEATGLVLKRPETLQLTVHQTLAGPIPVLQAGCREDFVSLVRALTMHNEPKPVPASMGACIVSGFNNWDRIRQYRQHWEACNSNHNSRTRWQEELQRIIPQKELYQDRFIILSDGFYSNVSAEDMHLPALDWQRLSHMIRLEHECTHYFTRRIFGLMRNNLLDELVADYQGIRAAIGHYRADWFLRFLGLESFPQYREGGRLQNYRGQSPLSDRAFTVLQALAKAAAENLEAFDAERTSEVNSSKTQPLTLLSLTCLTLEELASNEANTRIQQASDLLQAVLTEPRTVRVCRSSSKSYRFTS